MMSEMQRVRVMSGSNATIGYDSSANAMDVSRLHSAIACKL